MMTSSPGSRTVFRITFMAPDAPHVMTTSRTPSFTPVSSAICRATAARVSSYPAFAIYRCIPGADASTTRRSSFLNSVGGSTMGLPRDRSKTLSAPCNAFRAEPSSNILRIHEPSTICWLTLCDIDIWTLLSPPRLHILKGDNKGKVTRILQYQSYLT